MIPHPCFRIDGLAHGAEQPDRRQVVLAGVFVAELHERAYGRRCGVEHGDLVVLADFPEAPRIGNHRRALIDNRGRAHGQGAISDIGMARDPADIGGAPEYIVILQIEHPEVGLNGIEQVTRAGMLYALGLAGGARGVEQEQRVLGFKPFRFAFAGLVFDDIVPPVITAVLHVDIVAGALEHDHVPDAVTLAFERLVGSGLEFDHLAATVTAIGGNQRGGRCIRDAVAQAFG